MWWICRILCESEGMLRWITQYISSTVCISRTTQSLSELSADLTGVNVEVEWTLFLFISGSHLWKCVYLRSEYTMSFIIPWNILKFNYKQTIQRIIIILMPIEPETLLLFSYITNAQCVHLGWYSRHLTDNPIHSKHVSACHDQSVPQLRLYVREVP